MLHLAQVERWFSSRCKAQKHFFQGHLYTQNWRGVKGRFKPDYHQHRSDSQTLQNVDPKSFKID